MRGRRIALLVGISAAVLAGCSYATPEPDEVGVNYTGGDLSSKEFKKCIGAGKREGVGINDPTYMYPAGQRTFKFDTTDDADREPFTVVSKDGIPMLVRGVVTFELNTDCDTIRTFHEQIGIKFGADIDGENTSENDPGWGRMLLTYMGTPLEQSLDASSQDYGWKQLYNDPTVKKGWEGSVVDAEKGAPQRIEDFAGKGYFQNLKILIQKPEPPANIVSAVTAQQEAVERASAANTDVATIKKLTAALGGPEAYIAYQNQKLLEQAVKSGKVQILPVPQGSSVQIPTR